jgi:hypothetical protein
MLKHFSTTTNRLERCRAQKKCKFSVHGSGVSDVSILESAATEAESTKNVDAYLTVRRQLDVLKNPASLFDEKLPVYNEDDQEFYDKLRARYDAVSKNGNEFHLAPENNSHSFYCYTCFGPMTDDSTESGFSANCANCNEEVEEASDAGPLLKRSEVMFFSDDETKRASWYHSSDSPDWEERIADGTITSVHAGSLNAAEDRVTGLGRKNDTTWVYELRIKPEASVDPNIFNDDPVNESAWKKQEDKSDVVRYMNLYEDSGSISVLLNSSQVEVVGKHQVS